MNPLFVPQESYNYMNISIKSDSIESAYKTALKTILYNGIDFNDERGDKMKTIYNMMVTIKNPLSNLERLDEMNKNGLIPYNRKFLDNYADQLINGPKKSEIPFEYTYWERLRKRWSRLSKRAFQSLENEEVMDSEYVDQIGEVIKILKKNPNTRRAVCATWIPSMDLKKSEVPCMNWLVFYNISDRLNGTMGFRSHDIFGAVVENWYGLSRLLEYVAERVDKKMGSLTTVSVNAHYNKMFEKDVIRIVDGKV